MRFTVVLAFLFANVAIAQDSRPNVMLIFVDDLNDWGGFGGHPNILTPNIDRLARQGVRFTRAYANAPACNPSRASILTGILPSTSGVYWNKQPWRPAMPDAITLPEYFSAQGYRTTGIGKIFHLPYNDLNAWDEFIPFVRSPEPESRPVNGKKDSFDWMPMAMGDEDMADFKTAQSAIDYLDQTFDKPFFLAVGLYKPHLPWYVPEKYFAMYPPESVTLPLHRDNDLDDVPLQGQLIARDRGDHEFVVKRGLWKDAIRAYSASITFVDGQVGRLLDALEKSPHRDNTIVVLLSDHGWHLGEKEAWRKFTLWEESTRVPFIIRLPSSSTGSICERTVSLVDLYPTLLELCGLPQHHRLEGRSLVPLIKVPTSEWKYPALTTQGMGNHAVRSERWRYIQYFDGTEELYDHSTDPNEWHNLANKPEYHQIKTELASWLPKTNAANAPFEVRNK